MKISRLLVLTALIGGLVGLLVARGSGEKGKPYSGPTHGPRPAPDCLTLSPSCPSKQPEERLESSESNETIGFTFAPPPDDAKPDISADEAMNISWQEGGYDGTSQTPTLVLVAKGGEFDHDTLVWVIRYKGYCFLPSRPIGVTPSPPYCQMRSAYTMIDGETGDFIVSWTPPPE
jgi:hypothetical protein